MSKPVAKNLTIVYLLLNAGLCLLLFGTRLLYAHDCCGYTESCSNHPPCSPTECQDKYGNPIACNNNGPTNNNNNPPCHDKFGNQVACNNNCGCCDPAASGYSSAVALAANCTPPPPTPTPDCQSGSPSNCCCPPCMKKYDYGWASGCCLPMANDTSKPSCAVSGNSPSCVPHGSYALDDPFELAGICCNPGTGYNLIYDTPYNYCYYFYTPSAPFYEGIVVHPTYPGEKGCGFNLPIGCVYRKNCRLQPPTGGIPRGICNQEEPFIVTLKPKVYGCTSGNGATGAPCSP